MKLLQRLRELRNGPDELTDTLSFNQYDFAIDADLDAYGIGATMEQDVMRFDYLDTKIGYTKT